MSEYLYQAFEHTPAYRERLIEVLRNNTNIEMGGYRMFDGSYAHAIQIPEELADFIFALKEHDAKVAPLKRMLEVGFAAGITNTLLNKFFGFDEIVAMDTFDGPPSTNVLWANLRFKNLTLICGDSGSSRSISTAKALGPFDLIFIDGDHSYEGVMRDIKNYAPMLSKFGIFAMHDIAAEWTGVPNAWRHLVESGEWATEEFVCPIYQRPFGIGIAKRK